MNQWLATYYHVLHRLKSPVYGICGVAPSTARRWAIGARIPSLKHWKKLVETAGLANDWDVFASTRLDAVAATRRKRGPRERTKAEKIQRKIMKLQAELLEAS